MTISQITTDKIQEIRAKYANLTEVEELFNVSDEVAAHNLTITALRGKGMLEPRPLFFRSEGEMGPDGVEDAHHIFAFYTVGDALCGHDGILHGGVQMILMDDVMGRASFEKLVKKIAVTGTMTTKFRSPIYVPNEFYIEAWVEKSVGRKAEVKGVVRLTKDDTITSEGDAIYIEPKFADEMTKLL